MNTNRGMLEAMEVAKLDVEQFDIKYGKFEE